jgi:hypothetical protein
MRGCRAGDEIEEGETGECCSLARLFGRTSDEVAVVYGSRRNRKEKARMLSVTILHGDKENEEESETNPTRQEGSLSVSIAASIKKNVRAAGSERKTTMATNHKSKHFSPHNF